jgi:hypothetical protein
MPCLGKNGHIGFDGERLIIDGYSSLPFDYGESFFHMVNVERKSCSRFDLQLAYGDGRCPPIFLLSTWRLKIPGKTSLSSTEAKSTMGIESSLLIFFPRGSAREKVTLLEGDGNDYFIIRGSSRLSCGKAISTPRVINSMRRRGTVPRKISSRVTLSAATPFKT